MSFYIGATGNTIYSERFQEIEDRIDIDEINISNIQKELYFGSYSITSNLNRVIDVSSNIFLNLYVGENSITCNLLNINSNLYIGDFSVSSNIKYLKNEIQNETQSNPKTAIYRVKQLELVVGDFSSGYGSKNIIDPQTLAIIGNTIYDAFVSIGSTIANLGAIVTIWPAIGAVATASQIAQANAQTANNKADRLLLMWDDSGNNVYFMKSGNLAIGILPKGSVLNNKLEVSGNINITNGSTYKVNNVNFGYSNLDHKLTAGTNISIGADYKINNTLTSGTNISIVSGVINNTLTAGNNISIVSGAINNTYTYTLPIAQGSTGSLGGVKVDGSTITINNTTGVISAVVAGSGADIFLDGGVNNRAYGWVNSTSSLGRVGVAGNYSTGSAVEDIVLRSQGKLILQSGITTPCMVIDTTNNAFFRNNVGIGTSILTINNVLDVGTKLKVSSTAPSDSLTIAGTSGNVGLGITTATNLLHLHKTAINSDLRFQITDGGTGSLAANGLVLGKGTNNRYFLYNYANTDLYFGTNAVERLTITAGGLVGIGVTNPTTGYLLDVNGSSIVRTNLLVGSTTNSSTNDNVAFAIPDATLYVRGAQTIGATTNIVFRGGLQGQANGKVKIWLASDASHSSYIENQHTGNGYTNLMFGTANGNVLPVERMRIAYTGAVGIQNTGYAIPNNYMASGSLTIGNNTDNYGGGTNWNTNTAGLLMECLDNTEIAIHDAGNSIHSFMRYTTNGNFTIGRNMGYGVANVSMAGALSVAGAITSSSYVYGASYVYSSGFLQGAGGGGAYRIVRPDSWVRLKNDGENVHLDFAAGKLYAHDTLDAQGIINLNNFTYVKMQSIANVGTDYVCIVGNPSSDPQGGYYNKVLYIAYNSFTGFHRCYVEDELCNDDNIDIFKNEYAGRIVISTGKIKTDATKKKENEEHEWFSLENKEGITVEDALPKIQLSRFRKDKRVYGVLGNPNRNLNNKGRIIVNGCGEGAICVCNRNGNIENGDYIQTSDILGYGERQDEPQHYNYTVAKAVMDCNFELDSPYYQCEELADGTRVAIIACVYKAS